MSYGCKHYWGSGYIEYGSDPRNWSKEKLEAKAKAWAVKCNMCEYEYPEVKQD